MSHTIARTNPMRLFEENYRLLLALLPELEHGYRFTLSDADGHRDLEVEVTERARYTTSLSLRKYFGHRGRLLADLTMDIRLYRDARVAEVTGYQQCARLPAPFEVDLTEPFHLLDEKRQVNQLLNDLLRGYSAHTLATVAFDCRTL